LLVAAVVSFSAPAVAMGHAHAHEDALEHRAGAPDHLPQVTAHTEAAPHGARSAPQGFEPADHGHLRSLVAVATRMATRVATTQLAAPAPVVVLLDAFAEGPTLRPLRAIVARPTTLLHAPRQPRAPPLG
jgi:hypothetical protein